MNEAVSIIEQLKVEKRVIGRPALGVQVGVASPTLRQDLKLGDREGLVVALVIPGSSADDAGLREHDFVLKANGKDVKQPQDLIEEVQKAGVGGKVSLQILRGGTPMTIEATVGEDAPGGQQ